MNQRILTWLLAPAVIAVSLFLIYKQVNDNPEADTSQVSAEEWVKGNPESQIVLIEYSDFQCPACKANHEGMVQPLLSEFGDHIKFVYRHFPLEKIHPNALLSAQAAEAAGLQGKFWEMHDLLFEKQEEWSKKSRGDAEDMFVGYAEQLGLNVEQFEDDLDSSATKKAVRADQSAGLDAGVNATPSFFLNGQFIKFTSLENARTTIGDQVRAKQQ